MISELREPINAYIEQLEQNTPKAAVHHYTSIEGALGILKSGRMWFTERTHLNDPFEISHGIEIAREILRCNGKKMEADKLGETAKKVFDDFRFFSASFSFEFDDACQWKKYGDKGRGAVLSFKTVAPSAFTNPKKFIDSLIIGNPSVISCPICYDMSSLRTVIDSILGKWNGENFLELSDHIFMISSMFKGAAWKSEKEYRFFVHLKRELALQCSRYKTQENNDHIIHYLDLPMQNRDLCDEFPIFRISLGPCVNSGDEAQIRNYLDENHIPIRQGVHRSSVVCHPDGW